MARHLNLHHPLKQLAQWVLRKELAQAHKSYCRVMNENSKLRVSLDERGKQVGRLTRVVTAGSSGFRRSLEKNLLSAEMQLEGARQICKQLEKTLR